MGAKVSTSLVGGDDCATDGKAVGARLGTLLGDGDGAIEGVELVVHFGTVNFISKVFAVALMINNDASPDSEPCKT